MKVIRTLRVDTFVDDEVPAVFLWDQGVGTVRAPKGILLRKTVFTRAESGGTLVASSDWYYNQSATAGIGTSTPFITSAGTYYSKGRVALYNGNGYTTYEANSTPNLIISGSSFMGIFNVATNVNGDIYGSELMADALGIELDLIAARGENNMLGYVRSTDLNATKINDPTEISKLEIRRTIPLYSVDGLTVIDNFIIDNSGVEIFVN